MVLCLGDDGLQSFSGPFSSFPLLFPHPAPPPLASSPASGRRLSNQPKLRLYALYPPRGGYSTVVRPNPQRSGRLFKTPRYGMELVKDLRCLLS